MKLAALPVAPGQGKDVIGCQYCGEDCLVDAATKRVTCATCVVKLAGSSALPGKRERP